MKQVGCRIWDAGYGCGMQEVGYGTEEVGYRMREVG